MSSNDKKRTTHIEREVQYSIGTTKIKEKLESKEKEEKKDDEKEK